MSVMSEFYAAQIAVITSHLQFMDKLMDDISLRLDEIDEQLQIDTEQAEEKRLTEEYYAGREHGMDELEEFWYSSYDPRPKREWHCTCPDCVEDSSYRMD